MIVPTCSVHIGDARKMLVNVPDESVQCVVTSPPYYQQRDYGMPDQIGLEATPEEYLDSMVEVFREVRRALRPDGTVWLNIGDTYNAYNCNRGEGGVLNRGAKHAMLPTFPKGLIDKTRRNKSLLGIPWRVANAMTADGWVLRSEIIWHKPSAKPSGGKDRPLTRHETVFQFARTSRSAYVDPTLRGFGSVWTFATASNGSGHSAPMPELLVRRCVEVGSRPGDTVLDPFHGSGTTGRAANYLGRHYVGVEVNPEYVLTEENP